MVGIRVDANEYIASGHVMRCLSIADAIVELGEDVIFFTSDDSAADLIKNRGFKVVLISSKWDHKDEELDDLIRELDIYKPRVLLVDSYQVTEHYLSRLHEVVRVAYIDDLNAFDYPVDIVINYSIYAEDLDYPKNKKYLLGIRYVPLRRQFDLSEEELSNILRYRKQRKQILITTGASNPYHAAERIISGILTEPKLKDYKIAVVRGRYWGSFEEGTIRVDHLGRVEIFENVENMADLMLNSYLAVSAGGSTLYELCACAVPTVTFSCADNQLGNVKGFSEREIMYYTGDIRALEDCYVKIVSKLIELSENDNIYEKNIEMLIKTHCSDGAMRIAETLCQ